MTAVGPPDGVHGPITTALIAAGARWFKARDEAIHDDGGPAQAVPGCPHLPACAGFCPANPRPEVQTDLSSRLGLETEPTSTTPAPVKATRGTTNGNARGSSYTRARRREWLVTTWRADVDAYLFESTDVLVPVPLGEGEPACRCYRCGCLLTVDTVSADRIIPGCRGGTYRRDNIRPACERCNSITGGGLRRA